MKTYQPNLLTSLELTADGDYVVHWNLLDSSGQAIGSMQRHFDSHGLDRSRLPIFEHLIQTTFPRLCVDVP